MQSRTITILKSLLLRFVVKSLTMGEIAFEKLACATGVRRVTSLDATRRFILWYCHRRSCNHVVTSKYESGRDSSTWNLSDDSQRVTLEPSARFFRWRVLDVFVSGNFYLWGGGGRPRKRLTWSSVVILSFGQRRWFARTVRSTKSPVPRASDVINEALIAAVRGPCFVFPLDPLSSFAT